MTSRLVVSALVLSLLYGCGPGENELALAKSVRGLETRVEQLTTEGEERAAELARALEENAGLGEALAGRFEGHQRAPTGRPEQGKQTDGQRLQ